MGTLISIVIVLLIAGLAVYLMQMLPMDPRFKQAAIGIVILMLIVWLLSLLFGFGGGPLFRLR